MTARQRPKSRSHYRPLFLLFGASVLVWALYAAVVLLFPFSGEFWESRGKFGDMFGAFTALFTGCAFAALVYGIRLEYKAFRRQELHSALSAQLDTLVQLFATPEAQRTPVWRAIVTAPGGPGEKYSIEQAIAVQIEALDRLMDGEDLEAVPTYGRPAVGGPVVSQASD
jgi:hypothetical protein